MIPEFANLCEQSISKPNFSDIFCDKNMLVQFILDPTSLNLQSRVSVSDPNVGLFFQLAKDYCFSIHNRRMSILKQKNDTIKSD